MITNPKIEKKKKDIARTELKFAEIKAKLREQKHELTDLENEEIVAMFRKEVITEDDFRSLIRARQETETDDEDDSLNERTSAAQIRKEETTNALSEN